MRKNILFLLIILAVIIQACNNVPSKNPEINLTVPETLDTTHTSQNSLDWYGTYEGTLPCADCSGIKVTLEINADGTFSYKDSYLEKNTQTSTMGKIMWHNNGSVIHLHTDEIDMKFKVGENILFKLDNDGNIITGNLAEKYRLYKIK